MNDELNDEKTCSLCKYKLGPIYSIAYVLHDIIEIHMKQLKIELIEILSKDK